jgi:capsular polysaccharide biosynthesis protein
MDVNEVFQRIVIGHLRLLAVCVLLPVAVLLATRPSDSVRYVATARLQASSATIGSTTEADSVLNRVKGIATSTAIIEQARLAAGLGDRDAVSLSSEISVTLLGSSAITDISVTDRSAATARALSSALASAVVGFISEQGGRQQALVSELQANQTQLYGERQSLVAAQARAPAQASSAATTAQLATVDQELADLSATLRQLQVASVSNSSASVISPAYSATRVHTTFWTKITLGVLAGLVAGLLAAALVEVVRPRIADGRSFARELDVPMLGSWRPTLTGASRARRALWWLTRRAGHVRDRASWAAQHPMGADAETLVAIRRGAAALKVNTLLLVGERNSPDVADLARRMTAQLRAEKGALLNGRAKSASIGAATAADTATSDTATSDTATSDTGALRTFVPPKTAVAVGLLKVLRLTDIEDLDRDNACALLVIAGRLTLYSRLRWIRDLATTTGWPILGVLDSGRSRSRR